MRVRDAKEIPLWQVLERLGHQPVKEVKGEKWYLSPFRPETEPSFKLTRDGKAWYDHGLGHGGTIIDFMLTLEAGTDVKQALARLDTLMGTTGKATSQSTLFSDSQPRSGALLNEIPTHSTPTDTPADDTTILSARELAHPALLQYLRQTRKIDPVLARSYLKEIHYQRHNKQYFALGFVNDEGGYELRNAFFKGGLGVKGITTLPAENDTGTVAVFEGFMDFLARLAISNQSAPRHAVIILNGTGQVKNAIATIREQGWDEVQCYLDNDVAGQTLATQLRDALEPSGVTVTDYAYSYQPFKDINAYWIDRVESQQQHRVL